MLLTLKNMKYITFVLLVLLTTFSSVYGEKSCNELIEAFFEYDDKEKMVEAISSSLKKELTKSSNGDILKEIAIEVAKQITCSQAEKKTSQIIKNVLNLFHPQIEQNSEEEIFLIKTICKAVKDTCANIDK